MEAPIAALLESYGFELVRGESAEATAARWLAGAEASWVHMAVLEALYQGRYKAISVEQILRAWQRRGEPVYHFGPEFERLVCQNLPQRTSPTPRAASRRLTLPKEIECFSPQPDSSALYSKLQSAARQQEASQEKSDTDEQT